MLVSPPMVSVASFLLMYHSTSKCAPQRRPDPAELFRAKIGDKLGWNFTGASSHPAPAIAAQAEHAAQYIRSMDGTVQTSAQEKQEVIAKSV